MFIFDVIGSLLSDNVGKFVDSKCMSADKEKTEQIDNLFAQSLRALATPKMTSDEVKRQFSQDIQNANIAILRLKQMQNDNAV
ncbi:MAG: hypothetical protein ISQ30_12735 [Rhodobacteraceae bacterium]|nr:hypothetical protein [Paracoccaceae bacterium]MBL6677125.1 hypothetical protein [Paracoccaceae bacterium]MBL6790303.1 hypothetical protein [Paracoccaceae bacterium]